MYFWKIEKLKNDLLKEPLSESESFKYLLATSVLYGLGMIPFWEKNMWDVYSAIITTLITAIGVYYVYKCNKGASGSNFLQKYLSMSWVVGIRWFIFVMIPLITVYSVIVAILSSIPENTILSDVLFFNLLVISYFWLLGKHVKEIAK